MKPKLPARKPEDLTAEEWATISAAVGRYSFDHQAECPTCREIQRGDQEERCRERFDLDALTDLTNLFYKETGP